MLPACAVADNLAAEPLARFKLEVLKLGLKRTTGNFVPEGHASLQVAKTFGRLP